MGNSSEEDEPSRLAIGACGGSDSKLGGSLIVWFECLGRAGVGLEVKVASGTRARAVLQRNNCECGPKGMASVVGGQSPY